MNAPITLVALATTAPVYSDADKAKAASIAAWLTANEKARSWLAAKLRISGAVVSTILNGKYPSPPTEHLTNMQAVIDVEAERMAEATPGYVEGSVHKLVQVVCDRTRKHANFGVVCGSVGVGKTRALKEYQARRPQTLLVEAAPLMTAGTLMIEILEQLHITPPAAMDRKFSAVVKAVKGTNTLLIIDEAENCSSQALHYVRRIRDIAEIGVVMAGTEKLVALIKPEHGQFDQIRSRVSMWPETIKRITRDDMDDIACAALSEFKGDVPQEVLDALWSYCDGSARVLTESLCPAVRDFGLGKHVLSAKLVDTVAKSVLFMTRRTK